MNFDDFLQNQCADFGDLDKKMISHKTKFGNIKGFLRIGYFICFHIKK